MRNPSVRVTMDPAFHDALLAFAESQNRTPSNVLLHAGKQFLSQHRAWVTRTQGRPFAHVRKGIESQTRDSRESQLSTKVDTP